MSTNSSALNLNKGKWSTSVSCNVTHDLPMAWPELQSCVPRRRRTEVAFRRTWKPQKIRFHAPTDESSVADANFFNLERGFTGPLVLHIMLVCKRVLNYWIINVVSDLCIPEIVAQSIQIGNIKSESGIQTLINE